MKTFIFKYTLTTLLAVTLLSSLAQASDWRVKPIRLDLNAKIKTGAITLINDGDTDLSFQVNAMQWSQDAEGKDIYTPTDDLIFFPKILTIDAHKDRIIRTGIKIPATDTEKTYRLFIEELPSKDPAEGTIIAVKVRFGVPVFAAPLEATHSGRLDALELKGEGLSVTIANAGNSHFRIVSLAAVGTDASGQEVFRNKIDGWYLLPGAQRDYTVPVSQNECRQAATITLESDSYDLDLKQILPKGQLACQRLNTP